MYLNLISSCFGRLLARFLGRYHSFSDIYAFFFRYRPSWATSPWKIQGSRWNSVLFLKMVTSRKFLFRTSVFCWVLKYSCLICISYVIIWFKLLASRCLKVWSVFTEERANYESLPNLLPPTKYTRPNRRKPEDSAVVELGVVAHNMWSITPGSMARAFHGVDFSGKLRCLVGR